MGQDYFSGDSGDVSGAAPTWVDWRSSKVLEVVEGLKIQALATDNVMVSFVTLDPHTEAAVHWHDEEQIAIVIDGELEFEVGDETRTLRRGEAVLIPSRVPHGARTHDAACFELDIFSPPRAALQEALGLEAWKENPA